MDQVSEQQKLELNRLFQFPYNKITYSEWFKIFRKHHIFHTVYNEAIGSDEWTYGYTIKYIPKKHENAKCRIAHFTYMDSLMIGSSSYTGGWNSYEEAELECLKKIIEIYKQEYVAIQE